METYCIRCGLTITLFEKYGKFGCSDCPDRFYEKALGRSGQYPYNGSFAGFVPMGRIVWSNIVYRLRLARCFRSDFFPYYTRSEERVSALLKAQKILFSETEKSSLPLVNGGRFYSGEEDHLRYEIIIPDTPSSSLLSNLFHNDIRFLFVPGIWAWSKSIGFINSCPTNCGRGDRLSVQGRISYDNFITISEQLSPFLGFGLDFSPVVDVSKEEIAFEGRILVRISCKNAIPKQKLRFFKILSLLGLG